MKVFFVLIILSSFSFITNAKEKENENIKEKIMYQAREVLNYIEYGTLYMDPKKIQLISIQLEMIKKCLTNEGESDCYPKK